MKYQLKKGVIAGAILAGGNARRIGGVAKGTLKAGGGASIVEHLINEMNHAGISDIVIIANNPEPYQDYGVKIIADIRESIGPIGGIEAGLFFFAGQSDAVMFVPCDMPNITVKEISALKESFIETESPVVFAETTGFFWHPLCAVVHNGLVKQVSSAIDCGERKIRNVWRQIKADRVLFDDESAFLNVNTSNDINQWRSICGGKI